MLKLTRASLLDSTNWRKADDSARHRGRAVVYFPPSLIQEWVNTMPKMKTHSGAKKRFRVTGSGKIMRQRARHVVR